MSMPPPAAPPGYPLAPPPSPPARRTRGPFVLGALVGVVLAAVVAGVLVVTGVVGDGGGSGASGGSGGGTEVALPDELDGLRSIEDVQADLQEDADKPVDSGVQDRSDALTEEAYAEAYDGADVAVARYADEDLLFMATVIAVGAPSPGPVSGPVADPADLGLAQNQQSFEQVGDVTCQRSLQEVVPEDEEVDPDEVGTYYCQETSDDLTVTVHAGGAVSGDEGLDRMVSLTEAAFEAAG